MALNDTSADPIERLLAPHQGSAPATLIVVAHPDDEIIGAGALLCRLGPAARVVYLTDGAPADGADARALGFTRVKDYARARRAEAEKALILAGVDPGRAEWLGWKDQTTAAELFELTLTLADVFRALAPEIILTHPYEGGHPDHDSAAFAVAEAAALLAREGAAAPPILEMTSYHANGATLEIGRFLPDADPGREVPLSEAGAALKRRMLETHRSQTRILEPFLDQLDCERFRRAPRYEFTRPPHPGPLWYERHDWAIKPERWCGLAGGALASLASTPRERTLVQ